MSGRVYQGENEDLRAEGKELSEAEIQSGLHWDYVEQTLQIHCIDQSEIGLCAHHYKTSFVHGWKHGQEAMNGKAKG